VIIVPGDINHLAWEIFYTDPWCPGIALILTITNTVAFSRCDKFSQASTFANRALGGGIVNNLAGGLLGRFFR
jgi:hypothetical protein